MTAPFVTQLRTHGAIIDLAGGSDASFLIRAQVHEAWDAVRVQVTASTPVADVKRAALAALLGEQSASDAYMVKIHGAEVRDERQPVSACGVRAGTTVFVHGRRRRAVR